MNTYYKDVENKFFYDKPELFQQLVKLNQLKYEIEQWKGELDQTILITILGSPRTGKTTTVYNIYDFLKKCGLDVCYLAEPANEIYQTFKSDEEKKNATKDLYNFNLKLRDFALEKLQANLNSNNFNVILYDRGFLDPYVWFNIYLQQGIINDITYEKRLKDLSKTKLGTYNLTLALYSSPFISAKRDYNNSLSLDKRKFINEEFLTLYKDALFKVRGKLTEFSDLCHYIDTTPLDIMSTSINVAENISLEILNVAKTKSLKKGGLTHAVL